MSSTINKSATLNPADRKAVQEIATIMMAMNERNDVNANQPGVFGHLWNAIVTFVLNQTGVDISNKDWNLGGNSTWVDDVQAAIYKAAECDSEKAVVGARVETVTNTRAIGGVFAAHVNFGVIERVTQHRIYVRNEHGNEQCHARYDAGRQMGTDRLTPNRILLVGAPAKKL